MRYFIEANGEPVMAEEEALALWRHACARGGERERDRERLAENFQPMVAAEARRFALRRAGRAAPAAPAEAIAGWGNLGLLRALCCYREGSIGFYEFCRRRIRETMLAEARAADAPAAYGIDGAAEVARLWGELGRKFSSPAEGRGKARPLPAGIG